MPTLASAATIKTVTPKAKKAPSAPKAKKGAVAPPATPPQDAPSAQSTVVAKVGKFRGLGTCAALGIPAGLRRMEFQDRLLALGLKKTDLELAAMMDAEHPGGVKIRPDHMRAIRRLYNEGKHTKFGTVPKILSTEFNAAGEIVPEKRGRNAVVAAA